MTTLEKIAYLKGIIAASNISDSQTKRIYEAILSVLDSIAEDVEFNANNIDNIDSRLSEVDEDLDAVESLVFGDDMFDSDDFAEDYSEDAYDAEEDDFEEYEDYAEEDDFSAEDDETLEDELEEGDDSLDDDEDDALAEEFDEDEEQGEEMYEIECPACHETIYLQESVILDGGVDCPNCGEPLEFDIEFEEE